MSVVRVGTNKKYSDNWDNIFSGKRGSASTTKKAKPAAKPAKSTKKTAKAAKKAAGKKKSGKRK